MFFIFSTHFVLFFVPFCFRHIKEAGCLSGKREREKKKAEDLLVVDVALKHIMKTAWAYLVSQNWKSKGNGGL